MTFSRKKIKIKKFPEYNRYFLREVPEPEVASVSKKRYKGFKRRTLRARCPLCGYYNCNIVIVDSRGDKGNTDH